MLAGGARGLKLAERLLEVEGLVKHFRGSGSWLGRNAEVIQAVDGVNFSIGEGETFALVGESGCGKTTVAKMILLLERPTGGVIRFRGNDVNGLRGSGLREYKRLVQAVFQDPYSSLNPRMQVLDIIGEPLQVHEGMHGRELRMRVGELLENVGLSPVTGSFFPHQFSGGQRQRIAIARALALRPQLIVLDEPVSGLDVSIRAQILNLLVDLQQDLGLSYLLISHDLAIVEHMSHRVGVMYVGKMVELGDKDQLYENTLHPYSKALLSSVLYPDPAASLPDFRLEAEIPSPIHLPTGCHLHPRCPIATPECAVTYPPLAELSAQRQAACYRSDVLVGAPAMREEGR